MIRVTEGSRPTLIIKTYDIDNIPTVASTLNYHVTRTDTGTTLVVSSALTPSERVEVVLPVAATTLAVTDKVPVRVAITVTATFSNNAVIVDELFFIVSPAH